MEHLLQATNIKEKIDVLGVEIATLINTIEDVVNTKTTYEIEFTSLKREDPKLQFNEDGDMLINHQNITMSKMQIGGIIYVPEVLDRSTFEVSDVESILMLGALLKYKKENRSLLIKEFNKLSLKLKL